MDNAQTKQSQIEAIEESLRDMSKILKQMARGLETDLSIQGMYSSKFQNIDRKDSRGGLKYLRTKKKPLLSATASKNICSGHKKTRTGIRTRFSSVKQAKIAWLMTGQSALKGEIGKEDLPQCLNPTMKQGDGGIVVRGCFSRSGVG